MVRVIAGSARRLLLKTPEGYDTRPTQDIIKETIFNSIQISVPGSHFLDLFAGSGSIGIEALSRGASSAVFVEKSRKNCDIIKENLSHTHLADKGTVMNADAVMAIRQLGKREKFDIVYMDPPYRDGLEEGVLRELKAGGILSEDALVIVEADKSNDMAFIKDAGFSLIREKLYKNNKHLILCPYPSKEE